MPKFDWSLSITKLVQKAHDVDTLGGAIFGHGHIVNKDGKDLQDDATHQISRL